MQVGIGHNSGRVAEPGQAWRTHAWRKARKALLPRLPIEVVRLRVARAAQLGLPYQTYAGIRASSGHDLIGFLFSSNALRVLRDGQDLPQDRQDKLMALQDTRVIGLAHRPVSVRHLRQLPATDAAYPAPLFTGRWSAMRDELRALIRAERQPADRFVIIGDTGAERDWAPAIGAAGYLQADQYFTVKNGNPSRRNGTETAPLE